MTPSPVPNQAMSLSISKYCVSCGTGLVATATMCPRCGSPALGVYSGVALNQGKSRATAVLLAVFLSFWSFLYTFREAKWKFWLGGGLVIGTFLVDTVDAIARPDHNSLLGFVWFMTSFGVWVWAIIDRSITPLDDPI